jgi:hypothetical protein
MILLFLLDSVIKLEEKVVFKCIFLMGDLVWEGLDGVGEFVGDGGSWEGVFCVVGDGWMGVGD